MRLLAVSLALLLGACVPTGESAEPTPSLDVWAGLRHSSRIVTPPPGEACRVSPRHELIGPFAGAAQAETSGTGTDPQIYAVGGDPLQVGPVDASGYQYGKVLWIAPPKSGERMLIRGQRIDGPGDIRFQPGGAELHFDPPVSDEGWRQMPSLVGVRTPGCYSFQIDATGFITIITVRVDARE